MLHGWPGSVKEFYHVFPLLTKPHNGFDFVFEVIAPSLPGYGFSDGGVKPGLGIAQIALIMKKLMETLGYKKFYVQGGDWGAVISSNMAALYPDSLFGLHCNMCGSFSMKTVLTLFIGSFWPSLIVDKPYEHRVYPLLKTFEYTIEESGYLHLQATKPDTVGVALQNSPVGLAAYILEKFSTWANKDYRRLSDGGLEKHFSMDDLLDNIMIYFVTGSITTSLRLYSESFNKKQKSLQLDRVPIKVPTVCAAYPNEILYTPETVLRDRYTNLLYLSHPSKGGHFAAFEEPEIFADDLWTAIAAIEKGHLKMDKIEL